MFINFSNHPADKWSPEQRHAAESLAGRIVDVSFPNIDPASSSEDVKRLALEYFDRIVEDSPDNNHDVIHVAGEMTFVYHFVKLCERSGIPCVAATTERMVKENPDGTKTVAFEFKQFRSYF